MDEKARSQEGSGSTLAVIFDGYKCLNDYPDTNETVEGGKEFGILGRPAPFMPHRPTPSVYLSLGSLQAVGINNFSVN